MAQSSSAESANRGEQSGRVLSVPLADHPSNLDPTAELVSSSRESLSIFRVRGGFIACQDGSALVELFSTQDAARSALSARGVQ